MTESRRGELGLLIRSINGVGRQLARVGLAPGRFTVEALERAARQQARLDDFGEPHYREWLARICDDIEAMGARLTTVGRLGLQRDLTRSLVTRLRTRELYRCHPEIADEVIEAPLIIIGFPRTGTTMLHNLLSRGSEVRAPELWELMEPAPRKLEQLGDADPRRLAGKRFQGELETVLPTLFAAHPMIWNWPEECLWLFANSFLSELWLARLHRGRFHEAFIQADWSFAVREYVDALKLLQWQDRKRGQPRRRWLLKAPGHSFRLAALAQALPDARFIRNHRDPRQTLASSCSLIELGRLATCPTPPRELGREMLETWVDCALEGLVRDSAGIADDRCFDMDFRELMRDPFGRVEALQGQLGVDLGDEGPMRQWLDDNPRHKRGKHQYSLERYGISEAEALERSAGYRSRFADFLADG